MPSVTDVSSVTRVFETIDEMEADEYASYFAEDASFRFGNAAAKVDFSLSGPVPWAVPELAAAGTVHVGGTRAELARAEAEVAAGRHPERPYMLVSQPGVGTSPVV